MAIQVADNFSYQGKKPLDGRTEYGTIAAMVAVSESILNDGCLAYVKENKKYYTFDSNNTIDSTLGKWRELESGSTITIDQIPTSGSTNAVQSGGTYTALEGKVDKVNGKGLSTEDFTTAEKTKLDGINLSNYIPTSQKGANSGVAELDANGKVPSTQLPSYVDDVVSKATKSEFPNPGEDDKIYIAKDENASYRWDGTEYVSISSANGLTLGETSSTAYRGDRGKTAYDDSQTNKTNIGTMANLTTTEKTNLVGAVNEVNGGLANKVDKVTGKGLSTNDYDNTEKGKVTNAQPQTLATAKTIEGASVTTVQGVADAVQTHTDKVVTGADGVHGFKVTTNGGTKMYYKSGANWVEIEVGSSTQVSTLPTASQGNVGKVLQYIGNTTSVAPIYKHGYFYECVENSEVYSWVNIPVMDVQEVQKTTLPTASATELGNIYQFVGTTTSSYTKGYYYECKAKGTEPETYEWQAISVQAGGSGGGQTIQYDTVPTASVDYVNKIIQYTGATTSVAPIYINGYFYKCMAQGTDPETYAWKEVDVQGSVIKPDITEIGVRIDDGFRPYIKVNASTIIPQFSTASFDDIALISDLYYSGALSLADIQNVWNVGDSKTIPVSAMLAEYVGETHDAQDVTMYIADFTHDDLTTPINGKAKALFTFSFTLSEDGQMNTNGADASGTSHGNEGGWKESARRSWCNDTCYEALPSGLKSAIKSVDRTTDKGSCSQESNVTSDKLFLPSSKDLTGSVVAPSGFNPYSAGVDSGVQYEMYKTDYPLDKKVYTTTTMGGKKNWAYAYYSSYWTGILADFSADYVRGDYTSGLFIHGCI